jgi:hypothetical protein
VRNKGNFVHEVSLVNPQTMPVTEQEFMQTWKGDRHMLTGMFRAKKRKMMDEHPFVRSH